MDRVYYLRCMDCGSIGLWVSLLGGVFVRLIVSKTYNHGIHLLLSVVITRISITAQLVQCCKSDGLNLSAIIFL